MGIWAFWVWDLGALGIPGMGSGGSGDPITGGWVLWGYQGGIWWVWGSHNGDLEALGVPGVGTGAVFGGPTW